MTSRKSAGLLLHRPAADHGGHEVLLAHMGGPLWARKDAGAWTLPKGEYQPDEQPLAAARREFAEEMGQAVPAGVTFVPLGEVRQRSGKIVTAWAVEADFDAEHITSNTFDMEWPPRSGRRQEFPEIDRAGWFGLELARQKIVAAQVPFLERLVEALSARPGPESR